MAGIQMGVTGATTFSQIEQRFASEQGGKDHNIRFQDGKGLYTSDKASLASIKKFFGFGDQFAARLQKRDDGVTQIKQSIDRQFNTPGLADRVLNHIRAEHGVDLSHGIKRSDLALLRQGLDEVTLADRRDAALGDPDRLALESAGNGEIDAPRLQRFLSNHFEACSSPQFWTNRDAKFNAENFGCGLSLSVLDRIQASGQITQKDLDDLRRVLGPWEGSGASPVPPIPTALLGPLTDDKLDQMTKLVFDRFASPTAAWPLNMDGFPHQADVRRTFADPLATGADKLVAMHDAYEATLSGQYLGSTNLSAPLRSIPG